MKSHNLHRANSLAEHEDLVISKLAREILENDAKQGSGTAMLYLAFIYEDGKGVSIDFELRDYWFNEIHKILPNISDIEDFYTLGKIAIFDYRIGITKLEALRFLEKSGSMGHPEALWEMYENTRFENSLNFDRLETLQLSANGLNTQAMIELASIKEKDDLAYATALLKTVMEIKELTKMKMFYDDK